jgi:insulysin
MADTNFKFKQKIPAGEFTRQINSEMQQPLPREWLLSGRSKLRKFDAAAILEALEYLQLNNFRMLIVSQELAGDLDQTEKWYSTKYKCENISEDLLNGLMKASTNSEDRPPELHLPPENQFIPRKLDVEMNDIKKTAIAPQLIKNNHLVRVWFKKDQTFLVPKANLFISCRIPLAFATADNALKTKLFTYLVRDTLEKYSYGPKLAGLRYSVLHSLAGLNINLSRYNEKLPILLE